MNNSIKFNMNDDDIPVIEEITTNILETSIFSKQYVKAIKEINDLYIEERLINSNNDCFYKTENHNNIFALIGDRGSGKTSCMLSIANLLNSPARRNVFDDVIVSDNALNNKEFIPLEIIDPSFFDDKHNILAIIIAKMFARFEKKIKSEPFSNDNNDKKELLELFTKVQKDFEVLFFNNQSQTFLDNVENLVSLSCAVNLKEDLELLIQKWLAYFAKEKKVKEVDCILLITIDDIDLNTRCADIMMEEIRKYLIQKNVLVLISFKFEQISMVKEQSLIKTYETLIKNNSSEMHETIKQMAETYLTKFIPLNNRIYMPDFSTNLKLPLLFDNEDNKDTQNLLSADQRILTYIYNKTRYLFYNTAKRTNPIIPHNLRQVRQLIKLLWNCEEYDSQPEFNDIKTKNSNEYNKELFKKYFYGDWCKRNLPSSYESFINQLNSINDAISINYYVIKELKKIYELNFRNITNKELEYIFNPENQDYNISIGDVYAVIFLLEKSNSIEIQNLLFALKTFYSIKLYEFYDKRTEISADTSQSKSLVIKTLDYLEKISDYEKLVGGSFINTRCITISAINQRTKQSRVLRPINLAPLKKQINEYLKYKGDIDEKILNITEFFVLCTSRVNNRRHFDEADLNLQYRVDNEPYYNVSFGSKGSVVFDIGTFLFNVTRLEACYNRFSVNDKFFYDFAKKKDGSLLKKFEKALEKREEVFYRNYHGIPDSEELDDETKEKLHNELKGNLKNRWLSFSSIRNYEILDDIINQLLLRQEDDAKSNPSDISRLSKIFETIGSYSKETYSLSEKSNRYYLITFSFAKEIANVLNNITSEGKDFFTSIYSPELLFSINKFDKKNITGENFLSKVEEIFRSNNMKYDIDEVKSILSYEDRMNKSIINNQIKDFINKLNTTYTLPED